MHRSLITLRRVLPLIATALMAVAALSSAAPAQALQKPAAPAMRSASAAVLAKTPTGDGAALLAQPTALRPSAAPVGLGWLAWSAAGAVLGVLLLGAGLHFRYASRPSASGPRDTPRRAARPHTHLQTEVDEYLGAETWVQGMRGTASADAAQRTQPVVFTKPVAANPAPGHTPRDFDAAAFARDSKVLFMRLTTAWDTQDKDELARLVAPHALPALTAQVEQACGNDGPVDFLTLDAQVLHITAASGQGEEKAEVRFHGLYRRPGQPTASPFDCVWSLIKDGSNWRLTAIQGL
jgi:hypothetical protein